MGSPPFARRRSRRLQRPAARRAAGHEQGDHRRDLATLERDFALVEETAGKQKKVYRIDHKIRALEAISFGTTELLAIYAAQAAIAGLYGTPIHEDLRSVMTKIRGFLSPRHNGGLDALSRVFVPHARGHVDYEPQRELIDELVDAIARRRTCQLTYRAAGKGADRAHRARPLRLVWHRSALYLLACLGDHQRITTLAAQRIRTFEDGGEPFTTPNVDVDEHVSRAFGIFVSDQEEDVEIVFDAEIAWKLEERTFHPRERKERRPDGKLSYRVRSSAQWEIIPWVQSYGALAELVAPTSWRAALRGMSRRCWPRTPPPGDRRLPRRLARLATTLTSCRGPPVSTSSASMASPAVSGSNRSRRPESLDSGSRDRATNPRHATAGIQG